MAAPAFENNNDLVSQWGIFRNEHCKVWFGSAQQFDSRAQLTDSFRVMHSLKCLDDDNSIEQKNVYYYDDERGTLTSSPGCGPWFYKRDESVETDGVHHPRWPNTRAVFFPSGCGILFNNSPVYYNDVTTCTKLMFRHPDRPNIRLSIMVEYSNYKPMRYRVYQENTSGWDSQFWSSQKEMVQPDCDWTLTSQHSLSSKCLYITQFDATVAECASPKELSQPELMGDFEELKSFPSYRTLSPTSQTQLVCPEVIEPNQRFYIGASWCLTPDKLLLQLIADFNEKLQFSRAVLSVSTPSQ